MEDKVFSENIKKTIEDLIYNLVSERPKNIVKYQKYLTDQDSEILKRIENKHFIYTLTSYLGALTFLSVKPFKNLEYITFDIAKRILEGCV